MMTKKEERMYANLFWKEYKAFLKQMVAYYSLLTQMYKKNKPKKDKNNTLSKWLYKRIEQNTKNQPKDVKNVTKEN